MSPEHLESRAAIVYPKLPTVCRTCLKDETSEEVELYQISEIFLGEGEVTAHIQSFEEVLGLFVNDELGKQNKQLPDTICLNCVEKARLAFQFIEMCRVTDSVLELCLSKGHSKADDRVSEEIQKNVEPTQEVGEGNETTEEYHVSVISDDEDSLKFETFDQENSSHDSACRNIQSTEGFKVILAVECKVPKKRKKQDASEKTCDICHKTFSQPQTLTRHKKIHNKESDPGEKCEYCNKTFLRADDMRRHIRTHTNERPYGCDVCPKAYRQLNELKDHKASAHPKEGKSRRIFSCSICNKQLTTRNGLYIHMKVHRGEKNHQCPFCERRYVTTGELLSHKRHKHGNERNVDMLKCDSPGCSSERFASKLALKRHCCNVHGRRQDLPETKRTKSK